MGNCKGYGIHCVLRPELECGQPQLTVIPESPNPFSRIQNTSLPLEPNTSVLPLTLLPQLHNKTQSNLEIAPLFVGRNLWRYTDSSGKSKYRKTGISRLETLVVAQ